MPGPFVSICIPAFNAERFVPETLASVRAQTFGNWELIVTEDGSHDRTEDIVREFSATVTQRVRFHRQTENCGAAATRNTCIAIARSEWIALLDADDRWTPDHLQVAVACARWHDADVVHGGTIYFDSDTGQQLEACKPSRTVLRDFSRALFRGDYTLEPSSVLLRRSLWERVGGFDPDLGCGESRDLWLRCARTGAVFSYTGHESCLHRRRGKLCSFTAAMALANAELIERNADWEALPKALRHRCAAAAWHSAGRLAMAENADTARKFFERALRHHAFAPITLAYWLVASARSVGRREN